MWWILMAEAQRLGARVVTARLPEGVLGWYVPSRHTIYLHRGLTRAQRVETLAHELGHAFYGHDCSTPQAERQAWRRAALLTVDPDLYRAAESECAEVGAIADRLELTVPLIEAWRDYWLPAVSTAINPTL